MAFDVELWQFYSHEIICQKSVTLYFVGDGEV